LGLGGTDKNVVPV